MQDRHMTQIVKAHEKLKAQKAEQKQATTPPKKLTETELQKYIDIVAQAAEGFVPEAHKPNTSLLDSILIARLEALGLSPAI